MARSGKPVRVLHSPLIGWRPYYKPPVVHDSRPVGSFFNDITMMMNERGPGPVMLLPASGGASERARSGKPSPSPSPKATPSQTPKKSLFKYSYCKIIRETQINRFERSWLFVPVLVLVSFFFGFSLSWALWHARKCCRKVSHATCAWPPCPCRGRFLGVITHGHEDKLRMDYFWASVGVCWDPWAGSNHHRTSARPGRLPFPTDSTKKKHPKHKSESKKTRLPGPIQPNDIVRRRRTKSHSSRS
ncbi:hypothetical protein F5888DRAFT_1694844 [Russula emetica]|nr:hypothetical protein F5888DRAFT_1694844 [Russula emetica]